jgi:hypothetical protein
VQEKSGSDAAADNADSTDYDDDTNDDAIASEDDVSESEESGSAESKENTSGVQEKSGSDAAADNADSTDYDDDTNDDAIASEDDVSESEESGSAESEENTSGMQENAGSDAAADNADSTDYDDDTNDDTIVYGEDDDDDDDDGDDDDDDDDDDDWMHDPANEPVDTIANRTAYRYMYHSRPSVEPTEAHTKPTTDQPSKAPTDLPTTNTPTKVPTDLPTYPPTKAPTDLPTTNAPTDAPTTPTNAPTKGPTNIPTEAPTHRPTLAPDLEEVRKKLLVGLMKDVSMKEAAGMLGDFDLNEDGEVDYDEIVETIHEYYYNDDDGSGHWEGAVWVADVGTKRTGNDERTGSLEGGISRFVAKFDRDHDGTVDDAEIRHMLMAYYDSGDVEIDVVDATGRDLEDDDAADLVPASPPTDVLSATPPLGVDKMEDVDGDEEQGEEQGGEQGEEQGEGWTNRWPLAQASLLSNPCTSGTHSCDTETSLCVHTPGWLADTASAATDTATAPDGDGTASQMLPPDDEVEDADANTDTPPAQFFAPYRERTRRLGEPNHEVTSEMSYTCECKPGYVVGEGGQLCVSHTAALDTSKAKAAVPSESAAEGGLTGWFGSLQGAEADAKGQPEGQGEGVLAERKAKAIANLRGAR